jgi:hypothetical protein
MKWILVLVATTALVSCATTARDPAALAWQHDRDVALAQKLDYAVVTDNGHTQFCATRAPTGSRVIPSCVTETQWELGHPDVAGGPADSSGIVQSGRSPFAGTLGY